MRTSPFSRIPKVFLALAAVVLLFTATTEGEIYRWVDEKGVVHFQDRPPADIKGSYKTYEPPPYAVAPSGTAEPTPVAPETPPAATPEYKAPEPVRLPEVELYTTSWCGYCAKARAFFRSRGIPFTEYDIEKDTKAARRKKRLHKSRGVPLAIINGVKISGFSEARYLRALSR